MEHHLRICLLGDNLLNDIVTTQSLVCHELSTVRHNHVIVVFQITSINHLFKWLLCLLCSVVCNWSLVFEGLFRDLHIGFCGQLYLKTKDYGYLLFKLIVYHVKTPIQLRYLLPSTNRLPPPRMLTSSATNLYAICIPILPSITLLYSIIIYQKWSFHQHRLPTLYKSYR